MSRTHARIYTRCLILAAVIATVTVIISSREMEKKAAADDIVDMALLGNETSLQSGDHARLIGPALPSSAPGTADAGAAETAHRLAFSVPREPVPIPFPDGESITVEFRRVPPLKPLDFSALPVVSDVNNAFTQYQIADGCLASLRGVDIPGAKAACTGTADYYDAERDRWLREASESGDVHALRIYADSSTNLPEALSHLEAAWEAGYIPPLGRIAEAYFELALAANEQRNKRKGLAYLWLQAHLQDAAAGDGRRMYVASLHEKVKLKQQQMDSSDVETAVQMAKELLRNNVHCCFGP